MLFIPSAIKMLLHSAALRFARSTEKMALHSISEASFHTTKLFDLLLFNQISRISRIFSSLFTHTSIIIGLLLILLIIPEHGRTYPVKIKDLTELAGVKDNFFVGYGLVTGLSGTGDRRSRFTQKSLSMLMEQNGIEIEDRHITTRNTAAVIVTATASGFLEKGDKVDIIVSSIGDARSLANGVLLPTSLKAGNGLIYIVGGGLLTLSRTDDPLTRSMLPQGGVIERDFSSPIDGTGNTDANPLLLYNQPTLRLKLNGNQLETAGLIKTAIEESFPNLSVAFLADKNLLIAERDNQIIDHALVLSILDLEIEQTASRTVVIDEAAGTVVVGGDVSIDPSLISLPTNSNRIESYTSLGYIPYNDTPPAPISYTTVEELLTELQGLGLDGYQIGSIFRALARSGGINAEIIFQ